MTNNVVSFPDNRVQGFNNDNDLSNESRKENKVENITEEKDMLDDNSHRLGLMGDEK